MASLIFESGYSAVTRGPALYCPVSRRFRHKGMSRSMMLWPFWQARIRRPWMASAMRQIEGCLELLDSREHDSSGPSRHQHCLLDGKFRPRGFQHDVGATAIRQVPDLFDRVGRGVHDMGCTHPGAASSRRRATCPRR